MSYTADELNLEIKNHGVWWEWRGELRHYTWNQFVSEAGEADWLIDKTLPLTVESYDREDEYMVVIMKLGDQYFRLLGNYDSWSGTTWDYAEFEEVVPRQITKTIYDRKKP